MPSSNSYAPKKEESSSQDCLFVTYEVGKKRKYGFIGVDNEYIPLTPPVSLNKLRKQLTLSANEEWLGFCEFPDSQASVEASNIVVLWNPTGRESVNFDLTKLRKDKLKEKKKHRKEYEPKHKGYDRTVVGFGVCPNASHPKLVRIRVNRETRRWLVDVLTLCKNLSENKIEGVWKKVNEYYDIPAFKDLIDLECAIVSAKGVVYFRDKYSTNGSRSNTVISFDLMSEKFDQVCLPKELVDAPLLKVAKVKESLGIIHYHDGVCDLWTKENRFTMKDTNEFTKKDTIRVEGKSLGVGDVLECRNNGDFVIELDAEIKVYNPSSGHLSGVGIKGTRYRSSARSYPLTPLLTHEVTL